MPTTRPQDRKPKKAAASKKAVTSAQDWKKARKNDELELPSGHVCRVKRPGLPQLLAEGILPDVLTPTAAQAIEAGKTGKEPSEEDLQSEFQNLISQPGGMQAMFDATDRVAAHCVLEPEMFWHRRPVDEDDPEQGFEDIPEDERDDELLYTDEVDFNDKLYIFNFVVGGANDLESFRQQVQ